MTEIANHTPGPNRVVDRGRREGYGLKRWDIYNDEIGDYVATMYPTLPVAKKSEAQRICQNLNARATGGAA